VDRDDILKDMRGRMRYKDAPDNTCQTCTYLDDSVPGYNICGLNPTYPFNTSTGATCSKHLYHGKTSGLNNLNK
jgi:hypothetical protein